MAIALDDRDQRILTLLEADAWLSYVELGGQVNLSASAAQRRVERLISAGIIRGARTVIDKPEAVSGLTVFLLAELTSETTQSLQRFTATVGAQPEVVEAWYVAGESDLLLKLHLADLPAYDRFVEAHINSSLLVGRFKTLTALRSLAPDAA